MIMASELQNEIPFLDEESGRENWEPERIELHHDYKNFIFQNVINLEMVVELNFAYGKHRKQLHNRQSQKTTIFKWTKKGITLNFIQNNKSQIVSSHWLIQFLWKYKTIDRISFGNFPNIFATITYQYGCLRWHCCLQTLVHFKSMKDVEWTAQWIDHCSRFMQFVFLRRLWKTYSKGGRCDSSTHFLTHPKIPSAFFWVFRCPPPGTIQKTECKPWTEVPIKILKWFMDHDVRLLRSSVYHVRISCALQHSKNQPVLHSWSM